MTSLYNCLKNSRLNFALGYSLLMLFTACERPSKILRLEQGSLSGIYAVTDNVARLYAQDPFSKETVLCKANFLFAIKAGDVKLLRVEMDFGQKGYRHNALSDGPEGNLRNVRRNAVVFELNEKTVSIPQGFPADLDMIFQDWIDERPLQGCQLDIDVSKRPWASFDPYKTLKSADAIGALDYRNQFCKQQSCWAQVYSDGAVRIGFALNEAKTELTWSPEASNIFQTENYLRE